MAIPAIAQNQLQFQVSGTVLSISLGGATWQIDNRIWGLETQPSIPQPITDESGEIVGFQPIIRQGRLAGTNMRFELEARLFKDAGNIWAVDLYFRKEARGTFRFSDWASGERTLPFRAPFPGTLVAGAHLEIPASRWLLRSDFSVRSDPRQIAKPIRLETGRFVAAAARLRIFPPRPATGAAPATFNGARFAFSGIAFERLDRSTIRSSRSAHRSNDTTKKTRGIVLASLDGGWVDLLPARSTIIVNADHPHRQIPTTIRVTGMGILSLAGLSGPAAGARLRLDRFELSGELKGIGRAAFLEAQIAGEPHGFRVGTFTASVISPGQPFGMRCDLNRALSNLAIPVRLVTVHSGVVGADRCDITFENTRAELRLGRFPAKTPPGFNVVDLGRGFANLSLDRARIDLRRSIDVFDLGFSLVGFRLALDQKSTSIVPTKGAAEQLLVVHFPSQHVLEETFRLPVRSLRRTLGRITSALSGLLNSTILANPPIVTPRDIDQPAQLNEDSKSETYLARTLAAGPSRLVFNIKGHGRWKAAQQLSLSLLENWSDLALVTHVRAAPATLPLESSQQGGNACREDQPVTCQLDVARICPTDPPEMARAKVRKSFVGPSDEQTALELVTGLIFSPDSSTRFAPPRSSRGGPPRLWTAQYPGDKSATRAIWAPDFDVDLVPETPEHRDDPGEKLGFKVLPSADSRREIVALTSAFGLGALRALDRQGKDVPAGSVRRPLADYNYLSPKTEKSPATGEEIFQEGIYMPRPFLRFDASLSAIGATLNAEWVGEPPAPYEESLFFSRAFNVERYEHRSRHARDAHVLVLKKGFLFPIGIRVTFVELAERHYLPFKGSGGPVAYLVLRRFIRRVTRRKAFPALYQPYFSNDLHFDGFELVTEQTPDIELRVVADAGGDEEIFWPVVHTAEATSEFAFEYQLDEERIVRRAPMLFVSNRAAHDPRRIEELIRYYNKLGPENGTEHLTLELVPDAPTTFAPAGRPGDTSFTTRSVSFAARPRFTPRKEGEEEDQPLYSMDGFMEGEDQPPWYPVMRHARVSMQSLDRLTGRPNGFIKVGYDPAYVVNAFDPTTNPSELYLRVLDEGIDLDVSGQGNATGGVAKPNARLAGISRRVGFVGGRPGKGPGDKDRADDDLHLEPGAKSSFDLASASSGKFDPFEFFGGPLAEAKLLGIIPLKEIVRSALIGAAPKLVEEFEHEIAGAAGGVVEVLLEIVRSTNVILTKVVDEAAAKIAERLGAHGGTSHQSFAALYPQLASALLRLQQTLDTAEEELANAPSPARVTEIVSAIARDGDAARRAIESFVRNPVPPVVKETVQRLRDQFESLRKIAEEIGSGDELVRTLVKAALGPIASEIASTGLAEVLFGPPEFGGQVGSPSPGTIGTETSSTRTVDEQDILRILREPELAAARASRALFGRFFSEPLLLALRALSGVDLAANPILSWSRASLADQIVQVLCAEAMRAWRQANPGQPQPVFDQRHLGSATNEVLTVIEASVEAQSTPPIASLPVILDRIGRALAANHARVVASVESARSELRQVETQTQAALAETIDALETPMVPGSATEQRRLELEALAAALRTKLEVTRGGGSILDLLLELLRSPASVADLRQKLLQPVERALGEATAVARQQADQLKVVARAELGRSTSRLTERLLEALKQTELFAALSRLGANASQWWSDANGGEAIEAAFALVDAMFDTAESISESVSKLSLAVDRLRLPNAQQTPQLKAFRENVASISASLKRLRTDIDRVGRHRDDARRLRDLWNGQMPLAGARPLASFAAGAPFSRDLLLNPVGRALALRETLVGRLRDLVAQLRNALATLPAATGGLGPSPKEITEIEEALADARLEVVQLAGKLTAFGARAGARSSQLEDAATTAGALGKQAADAIGEARSAFSDAAAGLEKVLSQAESSFEALDAWLASLEEFTRSADRELVATILAPAALPSVLADLAANLLAEPARKLIGLLGPAHDRAKNAVDAVVELLRTPDPIAQTMIALLNPEIVRRLEAAAEMLRKDQESLSAIVDALGQPPASPPSIPDLFAQVDALNDRWRIADPGLAQTIDLVRDVVTALASGQLSDLVSLDGLRDHLKDIVARLIPARVKLKYEWEAPLSDYPSDDPIFSINREAILDDEDPATARIPRPGEGRDLVLSTKVDVDLLSGDRSVAAYGGIAPFKIHLLGGSLDLLKIYFKGAYFEAKAGQKANFQAEIDRVEIGKALEFIQPLQAYFGNFAVFVRPVPYPLGIEAGFEFSEPYINIGIEFLNVAFGASLFLPFEDRTAEIRANFASREAPFLVIVPGTPPMGGGGFVRLVASARGVISFEIQVEFGAMMVLRYPPVRAFGKVTAGLYLLSRSGLRIFEGFVHALGEGQVACFGIAVNVEVTVRQRNGGDMEGSSTYSVSFKIGFAKFTYKFTAAYNVPGGGSGQSRLYSAGIAPNQGNRIFALRSGGGADRESTRSPEPFARVLAPNKQRNWEAYAANFSQEW